MNRETATLGALIVFVLLIRGAVVGVSLENLRLDPDAYASIANCYSEFGVLGQVENSAAGMGVRPTAFRPPFYPISLSIISGGLPVSPVTVGLFQFGLGILTILLTWCLASRIDGRRTANLTLVLLGLDPLLLQQSTLMMTETLATFFSVAMLLALDQLMRKPNLPRAITAGTTFGLACLTRPTFLPYACLCCAWILVRQSRSEYLRITVVWFMAIVVLVGLWAWRNYLIFGQPIATTTHGGYTLLLGNNPSFYRYLSEAAFDDPWDPSSFHAAWNSRDRRADASGFWDASISADQRTAEQPTGQRIIRSEVEDDRFAYEIAKHAIRNDLWSFLHSCIVRISWLWRPLPQKLAGSESQARHLVRWLVAVWYVVIFVAAARCLWHLRGQVFSSPWCWGVLMMLVFTGVHAVYWSNIRMRTPLMPFVVILASASIGRGFGSGWGSKR